MVEAQEVFDLRIEYLEIEGFCDVVAGAGGEAFELLLFAGEGRQQDDGGVEGSFVRFYFVAQLDAVHHGHRYIAYYQQGVVGECFLPAFFTVGRFDYLVVVPQIIF